MCRNTRPELFKALKTKTQKNMGEGGIQDRNPAKIKMGKSKAQKSQTLA